MAETLASIWKSLTVAGMPSATPLRPADTTLQVVGNKTPPTALHARLLEISGTRILVTGNNETVAFYVDKPDELDFNFKHMSGRDFDGVRFHLAANVYLGLGYSVQLWARLESGELIYHVEYAG